MAIAFDSSGAGSIINNVTVTFSHTCSGSNRLLLVFAKINSGPFIDVKYGGVSMTLLGAHSTIPTWAVYYMVNPPAGTANVTIQGSDLRNQGVSVSYTGVKQTGFPNVSKLTASSTGTAVSDSVTTTVDNCWVAAGDMFQVSVASEPSAGANTTRRNGTNNATISVSLSAFDTNAAVTPAGSRTLNFSSTLSQTHYMLLVGFEPAPEDASNQFFALME